MLHLQNEKKDKTSFDSLSNSERANMRHWGSVTLIVNMKEMGSVTRNVGFARHKV